MVVDSEPSHKPLISKASFVTDSTKKRFIYDQVMTEGAKPNAIMPVVDFLITLLLEVEITTIRIPLAPSPLRMPPPTKDRFWLLTAIDEASFSTSSQIKRVETNKFVERMVSLRRVRLSFPHENLHRTSA